ncbi:MAG: hypothetical protein QME25_08800 [Bacteroidota bacterium]|nr:hypothetical protein [Bacteroidota bacterium]
MFRKLFSIILMLVIGLTLFSCRKEGPVNLKPNLPPKTYLWIHADTIQSAVTSRQIIRWWGEDPDGLIQGYLFAYFKTDSVVAGQIPDTLGYSWVVKNDSLVAFPLLSARERFTVIAHAVDNSLRENINVGALIRLKPEPYWDKNENGIFNNNDLKLPGLKSAMDPVGAKQIFPIKNTPPDVFFSRDPLDPLKTIQQPETTFTVVTFTWTGTDIDGDHTIRNYRINLNNPNDETRWFEFSASHSMVTIEAPRSRTDQASGEVNADVYVGIFPTMYKIGEVPGLKLDDTNKVYLQAKDIAGEYSPVVSLPQGTRKWFVRKPKSQLLTVINADLVVNDTVVPFYRKSFASIDTFPGVTTPRNFGNFDVLNIRRGASDTKVGDLVPPILNPAFIRTLKLFDYLFWFTDYIPDNWILMHSVAQYPLYLYNGSGGKVLYSTRFGNFLGDPRGSLVDFAPVNSVGDTLIDSRVPNDWPIYPDSSSFHTPFPTLRFNATATSTGLHYFFIRDIYKRADAKYIYRIPRVPNRPTWTAKDSLVNIGVIDDAKTFVFLSIPLHLMNSYQKRWSDRPGVDGKGVPAFLKRVFIDEFGG